MNGRLGSRVDKALNKQNRKRRENIRRSARKRNAAICGLVAATSIKAEMVSCWSGDEALILLGGHLKKVAAIVPGLIRRAIALVPKGVDPSQSDAGLEEAPAMPRRLVRRSRTPDLRPWLVIDQPPTARLSVDEALLVAERSVAQRTACHLLDGFQRATGLSWGIADELLCRAGVIKDRALPGIFEHMEWARTFWTQWHDARELYRAALMLGQIKQVASDCGLVAQRDISKLLPGLVVPREELREDYVIRLTRATDASLELHFLSLNLRPCFRVLLG